MKKAGAILALGAAAGVAFYKFNELVYNSLLDRNFTVPSFLSSLFSDPDSTDSSEEKERIKENMGWLLSCNIEKHTIISDRGHRLQGYLIRPEKESDVYVFGSHGYKSDGKGEWCHYAKHYIEDRGYNMFFVDHQAAGESEGQYYGFASFESEDSLKWLDYMNRTFGKDIKIILHGISMGSTTVMLMSGNEGLPENVKFTIADCGFTSALDEFTYKLESMKLPKQPLVPMIKRLQKKRAGYDFREDTNALAAVAKAKVPMLFIHGDKDNFVPTYMAYLLHEACTAEYKDILIVHGADHAHSYSVGKEEYEAKITEFIEKFI